MVKKLDCASKIKAAKLAPDLDAEEINSIVDDMTAALDQRGLKPLKSILNERLADAELAAAVRRRTKAFDKLAQTRGIEEVLKQSPKSKDWARGVLSLMHGREGYQSKSAMGLAQSYHADFTRYNTRIEALGDEAMDVYWKGTRDLEIKEAMVALKTGESTGAMRRLDVQLAEILNEAQDNMLNNLQARGGWVNRRADYTLPQAYDMDRVAKMEFSEFANVLERNFDFQETFGMTRDAIYANPDLLAKYQGQMRQWKTDFASGTHFKAGGEGRISIEGGGGNIFKRVSEQRVIHYKGAKSQHAVMEAIGNPSLHEGMEFMALRRAREVGIASVFGPNYRANAEAMVGTLIKKAQADNNEAALKAFGGNFRNKFNDSMDGMDGTASIPGSAPISAFSGMMRGLQAWTKLGRAAISMGTDAPLVGSEMRAQGAGLLDGELNWIKEVAGVFKKQPERDDFFRSMGIMMDDVRIGLLDPMNPGDMAKGAASLPGKINRMTQSLTKTFGKFSGMTMMANAARRASAQGFVDVVGGWAGKGWDDLNPGFRGTMEIANIDKTDWDVMRTMVRSEEIEGRSFRAIEPNAMANIPDGTIDGLLSERGVTPSASSRTQARLELKDKLFAYYRDSTYSGSIEPKVELREWMRMGTRPGTAGGEAVRHVGLFKSFPIAVITQSFGRHIKMAGGAKAWKQWLPNTAQTMVSMTALGYATSALKDMSRNKTPRDPSEFTTWVDAFLSSGAAGIYADLMFTQGDRFGGNFLTALMGPTAGTINDTAELWRRFREGDDTASSMVRFLYNHTPANNLFYTRWATDHLFMNKVMDSINPGSVERSIQRVERDTGQTELFQ